MQFSLHPASASDLMPSLQRSRLLRVLVVGPELLANALQALLTTIDDIQVLTPISVLDQVLPFIERVSSTEHSLDVVILHWSSDPERDHQLLKALAKARQHCLIITSFSFPQEMEWIKQAGAWGLFFTHSPVQHLVTAVRTIASGQKSFPESFQARSTSNLISLTKPRQMAFHEERLEALAHEIMWKLTQTERNIFRHITDPSIKEIATNIHLSPVTVRRELSERVYEFLELICGRPVSNRLAALHVLQQYGVIEYVPLPPSN
jgi:DNA-binding NarL/FixJ family response regulator